jgi:hypothetical protein
VEFWSAGCRPGRREKGGFLTVRKLALALAACFLPALGSAGQYATAEDGYYPSGYHGRAFTGAVTSTNDETREVTLSYTNPKDGKTQTLVGMLEEGYSVKLKDGSLHELKPSEIKPGARIKVYYMTTTKKVSGEKTTVNTIFLIGGTPNVRARLSYFMAFH